LSPNTNITKCIICGERVSQDGYKISWGIEDLYIGEKDEERYFCCINCVRRWINQLEKTGLEKTIYLDNIAHTKQSYSNVC
jgi:hypothetical protein